MSEVLSWLAASVPTAQTVSWEYELAASVTGMLAEKVSPPSREAAARTLQPRLSLASRRSYQLTSTTPSLFTATEGNMWSGPLPASAGVRSSFTTVGLDQVLPWSAEYESRI